MRILLLTILFVGSFYLFKQDEKVSSSEIDSVKLKMGAPDRAERILTVEKPLVAPLDAVSPATGTAAASEAPEAEAKPEVGSAQESDLEHVEEIQLNDLEAAWNSELKQFLTRLEPIDGEAIHNAYVSEQESYQAELDALMSDKQQKSGEEADDLEELINQLDQKHQDKLKEILGAHYEAVHDHYAYFMEIASSEQ